MENTQNNNLKKKKKQLYLVRILFNDNVLRNDFNQNGLIVSLKMCFDDYDNKKELTGQTFTYTT